ncbi:DinB family protein [Streptomyces sp. NPDC001435]|uniref:DinB family protein n=1 Tax=unclassified Streptomyces TaxID=2593676 RepID=UPI0036C8E7AE
MSENSESVVTESVVTESVVTGQVPHEPVLLEPPVDGSEIDTLLGSLERQRRTLAWKCEGLDAAGLRATLAPSSVTLGGLLKHLALVEDEYLTRRLLGERMPAPWDTAEWDAEPDWEWRSAASDTPEQLYGLWRDAVARSRAGVRRAVAEGGAGHRAAVTFRTGESPSLRRLLVDLIEEYARHVGHADLIRESIDGRVGEDPPADF